MVCVPHMSQGDVGRAEKLLLKPCKHQASPCAPHASYFCTYQDVTLRHMLFGTCHTLITSVRIYLPLRVCSAWWLLTRTISTHVIYVHVWPCRSLGTCSRVGVPAATLSVSPVPVRARCQLSVSSLLLPHVLSYCAEGKAGSLVDDSGHFYKPLQVHPHTSEPSSFPRHSSEDVCL